MTNETCPYEYRLNKRLTVCKTQQEGCPVKCEYRKGYPGVPMYYCKRAARIADAEYIFARTKKDMMERLIQGERI